MNGLEAKEREALHHARRYPPAVYKITPDLFMDPYAHHSVEQNEGVWLNHSRSRPNCRVVSVQRQGKVVALVVVAVKDISLGEELVQIEGKIVTPLTFCFINLYFS